MAEMRHVLASTSHRAASCVGYWPQRLWRCPAPRSADAVPIVHARLADDGAMRGQRRLPAPLGPLHQRAEQPVAPRTVTLSPGSLPSGIGNLCAVCERSLLVSVNGQTQTT